TTWSASADFLSIRNCTCMSTQPSLRLRPAAFGTSRILARYIFAAPPRRAIFRLVFRTACFTIALHHPVTAAPAVQNKSSGLVHCTHAMPMRAVLKSPATLAASSHRSGSLWKHPRAALGLASKAAIDFVRSHEIAVLESEPAARIHDFVGGRCERHGAAEFAAEFEREQHVLLLQRDVGKRGRRHLSLEDERPAIGQHGRGGDALEDGVERDLSRYTAFFRKCHGLAERGDLNHEQQVDGDLHLHRKPAASDI